MRTPNDFRKEMERINLENSKYRCTQLELIEKSINNAFTKIDGHSTIIKIFLPFNGLESLETSVSAILEYYGWQINSNKQGQLYLTPND